jgi:release factor glutamine methyltransferase
MTFRHGQSRRNSEAANGGPRSDTSRHLTRGHQSSRPLREAIEQAIALMERAGVPSPTSDAELLIGYVLQLSRGEVQAKAITETSITADEAARIEAVVGRRAGREPLQHITGRAAFRAIEVAVGPGVFVPRPETELVAGIAIDALRAIASVDPIAVDLGTGSGAIALALATEVPHAVVYGVEVSPLAYIWTKQNFRTLAPTNAIPIFTDLSDALPQLSGSVSVVVSNPPYIPVGAIPRDPEVRLFDPEIALYGGEDGLDVIRQISTTARRMLHAGGTLVLEHGETQGAEIAALLEADGWSAIAGHRDLLGRDRATTALR